MSGYVSHYAGSRNQRWTTPREFFLRLDSRFNFTLDGAADVETTQLRRFIGPNDIFVTWRGERVFCNPPWSRIALFVELAAEADLAVLLVPARCNSRWFHRALELGASVEFFLGRPRFGDGGGSSPMDCLMLVFAANGEAPSRPL